MTDKAVLEKSERTRSLEDEYRALTGGVALVDRSEVGRLVVRGEDALDLLNRLSTNDLAVLEPHSGASTVLTSNKGRIIDLLTVIRREDDLLVLTGPDTHGKVVEWLDFYTFAEDVAVEDVTESTAMLSLVGPEALASLRALVGNDGLSIAPFGHAAVNVLGADASVVRTDFPRVPAYDLVAPAGERYSLRAALLEASEGVRPASLKATEALRVEQGVPGHGAELDERFNPLEAGLLPLVSFTKGCYVGQEVVTRLNTYDKVQKRLVGLLWDSDARPPAGVKLLLDAKQVGVVTSSVRSPRLGRHVGLGYVRTAQAQPGTVVTAESPDGPIDTEVADLPLR